MTPWPNLSSGPTRESLCQSNSWTLFSRRVLGISGDGTITGSLTLSRGELSGSGTLTVTETMTWTGGTITGSGRSRITGNLHLVGGAGSLQLQGHSRYLYQEQRWKDHPLRDFQQQRVATGTDGNNRPASR